MEKGLKSTEFWFGLFVIVLTYFNDALGLNLPKEAIISIVALAISYIVGRTVYKVAGARFGLGRKK